MVTGELTQKDCCFFQLSQSGIGLDFGLCDLINIMYLHITYKHLSNILTQITFL